MTAGSSNNNNDSALKEYVVHMVPCRVRYTGPTQEFEQNFLKDETEMSARKDDRVVNYIRGRKIIGQDVKPLMCPDTEAYLVEETSVEGTPETVSHLKPVAKLTHMYNYEREGNELRLDEELQRFQELIALKNTIHG